MTVALVLVLAAAPSAREQAEFDGLAASRDDALERMQAFVDAHPGSPLAARGLLGIARIHLDRRQPDRARPLLERALAACPASEWADEAMAELARLDLADGRLDDAEARYRRLRNLPDEATRFAAEIGLAQVHAARVQWLALFLCAGFLVALGGARLAVAAGSGRRPWIPPREVLFTTIPLLLVVASAHRRPAAETHALAIIAAGGTALLWAHGAWIRDRTLDAAARARETALGIAQTAALLYCAVAASDLWPRLAETLRERAGR